MSYARDLRQTPYHVTRPPVVPTCRRCGGQRVATRDCTDDCVRLKADAPLAAKLGLKHRHIYCTDKDCLGNAIEYWIG